MMEAPLAPQQRAPLGMHPGGMSMAPFGMEPIVADPEPSIVKEGWLNKRGQSMAGAAVITLFSIRNHCNAICGSCHMNLACLS